MDKLIRTGIALTVLLGATALALSAEDPEEITIYGKIEVAQEDDEGKVLAVSIFDPSEGACLVASQEGRGELLARHVGVWVEATGRLEPSDDPDFDWVIVVSSFVLEDEEEIPDDDAREGS